MLRKEVYAREGNQCQICKDSLTILHCHEDWMYEDRKHIQKMRQLMAICKTCHDSIHWFRTEGQVFSGQGSIEGYPEDYLQTIRLHLRLVNKCSETQFNSHVRNSYHLRDIRSKFEYKLDYGIYSPEEITKKYQGLINGNS